MALTLGDVLLSAGIDPSDTQAIRHAFVRERRQSALRRALAARCRVSKSTRPQRSGAESPEAPGQAVDVLLRGATWQRRLEVDTARVAEVGRVVDE